MNETLVTPLLGRHEMHLAHVEELDDSLLNTAYQRLEDGKVEEAMSDLGRGMFERRLNSPDQEWEEYVAMCLRHPIRRMLHQDPFTNRAFSKPRGYAGDAVMLDYVYRSEDGEYALPPDTTELGYKIMEFTTRSPASLGVLARREFIANQLDRFAEERSKPHVFAVASGHLREASVSRAVKRRKLGRFVALDADPSSLEEVQRCYGHLGVEVAAASIRKLIGGEVKIGTFDLVYATGLLDYVRLNTAQRLMLSLFRMLHSGGRLVVANYLPGVGDVGYMESFMAWMLVYRTRQEMMEITMSIPQPEIRDIRLFTEENENIIFLEVAKK